MPTEPTLYGNPPVDLGLIDLDIKEHLCWLYCPIKLPHTDCDPVFCPPNLLQFSPIISRVMTDLGLSGLIKHDEAYVYLTAKRIFVTPEAPGNRPGAHSDGFMTDDLNYVWSDGNPTLFWEPPQLEVFTQDHALSLAEMENAMSRGPNRTYPDKHLLRLDQTVIHRVNDVTTSGMRTFVKISVSKHKYALEGNSINHELAPDWAYEAREETRNAPEGKR